MQEGGDILKNQTLSPKLLCLILLWLVVTILSPSDVSASTAPAVNAKLEINYLDTSGKEISASQVLMNLRIGNEYATQAPQFLGYQVDLRNYPTNYDGKINSASTIVVNYIYQVDAKQQEGVLPMGTSSQEDRPLMTSTTTSAPVFQAASSPVDLPKTGDDQSPLTVLGGLILIGMAGFWARKRMKQEFCNQANK